MIQIAPIPSSALGHCEVRDVPDKKIVSLEMWHVHNMHLTFFGMWILSRYTKLSTFVGVCLCVPNLERSCLFKRLDSIYKCMVFHRMSILFDLLLFNHIPIPLKKTCFFHCSHQFLPSSVSTLARSTTSKMEHSMETRCEETLPKRLNTNQ